MQIQSYQVGDLPLLGEVLSRSGLVELLDSHYPTHPNRQGPSVGKTVLIWLMYIISQNDHRLSHVQDWVEQSLAVLRWVCQEPQLEACHLSDDYLGSLLEQFSCSSCWAAYEAQQNERLLQVYQLAPSIVRLDATQVTSFRPEGGLFQRGHSKQRRSDLPQLKLMLASLDPLSLPLASYAVSGQRADDGLYIPIIEQAQQSLQPHGLLYVGDTKLGNQANFSHLARSQNFYLCPLSLRQFGEQPLQQAIDSALQHSQEIQSVYQQDQVIVQVYELPSRLLSHAEHSFEWTQRYILVKSLELAQRKTKDLQNRLNKAQLQILERFLPKQGRKIFRQLDQAQAFIERVTKRHQVQGLLNAHLKLRPDTKRKGQIVHCQLQVQQNKVQQTIKQHGWRVYATNCPIQQLSAEQLVLIYRQQYRIEQNFHQLLNKVTQLMPIFLSKQTRIKGLIRLLILALKFVNLLQHKVRQTLKQNREQLTGLVPGNPGRKVKQPTTALLLRAFTTIKLFVFQLPTGPIQFQVEPLNSTQMKILKALKLPPEIYLHPCQRT